MELDGSATHENLKAAFARESKASRKYEWFAEQADVEGYPEAAALLRSIAGIEAGHAQGHLEYLADLGDPETGQPIGDTRDNLTAALTIEERESREMYPQFAQTAREEGLDDVADWFESMATAESAHAERLRSHLEQM